VDKAGLKRLLQVIEAEGEEIQERVGRGRALFKENILRLIKDLMEQKSETQISWLSGNGRDEHSEESK
jgi:hypothetical protein